MIDRPSHTLLLMYNHGTRSHGQGHSRKEGRKCIVLEWIIGFNSSRTVVWLGIVDLGVDVDVMWSDVACLWLERNEGPWHWWREELWTQYHTGNATVPVAPSTQINEWRNYHRKITRKAKEVFYSEIKVNAMPQYQIESFTSVYLTVTYLIRFESRRKATRTSMALTARRDEKRRDLDEGWECLTTKE